jgi:hypothetical protein
LKVQPKRQCVSLWSPVSSPTGAALASQCLNEYAQIR